VSAAATALNRREAARRGVATACLTGIAVVQAIGLPALVARSALVGVLSLAAAGLCVGGGLALAAAGPSASPAVWRAVAATSALALAGWALPRAVALPAPAGARGDWASMPGVACAGLAAVCLLLAATSVQSARTAARGAAVAAALAVALGPGVVALLVAAGPGPAGGEAAIAQQHTRGHAHPSASEPVIVRRPGRGGDHFVTRVATTPHPPAIAVALAAAAASFFVLAALASLHERTSDGQPSGHLSARSRAR